MSTDTTTLLLKTCANRARSYVIPAGTVPRLNELKAQVHIDIAPPDAPFPYVVLTILEAETDPDFGGRCEKLSLEATIHGRSREDIEVVRSIDDALRQAFLSFHEASADFGLTYFTGVRREAPAPLGSPSAPEAFAMRLVFDGVTWPAVLTDAIP